MTERTRRRPVPWWLWPNLLGLDAPAVAVVWQRFLADASGVAVPVAASAVLALVVWGIYLTDRRLDARAGNGTRLRNISDGKPRPSRSSWRARCASTGMASRLTSSGVT